MADLSGELLRRQAMSLLSARYGEVRREHRASGKRADLYFSHQHLGRLEKVYVECKDYAGPLKRHEIERIWAAYEGIVRKSAPALLLVVTRHGLTSDAAAFIDCEHHELRHETVWDLENSVLGLGDYTESLCGLFNEDGLSKYYVEARASEIAYNAATQDALSETRVGSIYSLIETWIAGSTDKPIAVLGGYGAGKSSLAKRIVSLQALKCRENHLLRRPILMKLGAFTGHTRLEGLLGAMFTYDFPVPSFNTHRFLELNERGRLVIVLDGFDEMKHAMTFADFRAQLMELNKLVRGDSRVILLGRPNAFLSLDERFYVLRGRSRLSETEWYRIPGWPEFREFRLADFSPDERHLFVSRYLHYLTSDGAMSETQEWAEGRAEEVNRIAANDPSVFAKPVHAKILTDLASDRQVDLGGLGVRVGRWRLYELFFVSLIRKEVEKDARRAIGEKARMDFLLLLAFWLWTEQSGQTAFHSFDIPLRILDSLPDGDSADPQAKLREYLTGAFLEEKYGGTYFFHHRSFAEFLVANYIFTHPPTGELHSVYAELLKEGVEEFLLEAPDAQQVAQWVKGLQECADPIPLRYLDHLAKQAGGVQELSEACGRGSPWRGFIRCFDGAISLLDVHVHNALSLVREGNETECLMALSLVLSRAGSISFQGVIVEESEEFLSAVFSRLFRGATTNLLHDLKVLEAARFIGEILSPGTQRAPEFQPTRKETWRVTVDLDALRKAVDGALRRRGVSLSWEETASSPPAYDVLATNISPRMLRPARPLFLEYIERNSSFEDLQYAREPRKRSY